MNEGLSKELFTFAVKREEEVSEASGGYSSTLKMLSCAFRRPLMIAPLTIIILILLFSLLLPLFIPRNADYLDPYYAKKGPRSSIMKSSLGVSMAETVRALGEAGAISLAAIGLGAYDNSLTLQDTLGGEYMPIVSYSEADGLYSLKVDTYLEVGFVYLAVSREEYEKMRLYEKETGIKLLYPLINNQDSKDRHNANLWYKTDGRGNPLNALGEIAKFTPDMTLSDNYLRDADGNPVYSIYTGGGNNESAGLRIRTLYYNYYRYKNGAPPDYLMGTDSQGYDLALRLAGGVRLSLGIALFVSLINLSLGAVIGAIEGYYGGAVDLVIERVRDIISGVPFIVVATLFQIHLGGKIGAIPSLLFAFVLTGWLSTASRMRAQFYRFKNSEYVLAARTLGASDFRIITKHVFPNTLGTLITSSALVIPRVIFSESMLSFLGIVNLGGEELTSLGTLLSEAGRVWTNFPHLILFPALFVSLLMISFNIIGNLLREALG